MKDITINTPRQKRSIAKFNQVLNAVPVALEEFGYRKITAAKLALEADIGIGSFYDYFSCKEAAFIAFLDRELNDVLTQIAIDAADQKLGAEQAIRVLITSGLDFATEHAELIKGMLVNSPGLLAKINLVQSKQRVIEIAAEFAQHQPLPLVNRDPNLMIYCLSSMVFGFQTRLSLLEDESFDREVVIDEIVRLIMLYLTQE